MSRKWLIGAGLVGLVAVLVWGNLRHVDGSREAATGTPTGPSGAPIVKVIEVERRDLTQTVLAPAILETGTLLQIRAAFASTGVELLVGEGDRVTAGQEIARLDSAEMRLHVTNLEATVARADAQLTGLLRQNETGPAQLAHRLSTAAAQLVQAQEGLAIALEQVSVAQQRVDQARAALLGLQTRSTTLGELAAAQRNRMVAAEESYRASPQSSARKQAYESAAAEYHLVLQRSNEEARQIGADLIAAEAAVVGAESDLRASKTPTAVVQARNQVDAAQRQIEGIRLEQAAGHVTAQQIRSAQADLSAALEALWQGQGRLEAAVIRAPSAGVIMVVAVKDGQPVTQEQSIVEVGTVDELKLRIRVDELDITKVHLGQKLGVKSAANPGRSFDGVVDRITARTTAGGGGSDHYEVFGRVANQGGELRVGMSAEVRIETDKRTETLVVGLESVREDGTEPEVLVVSDFAVVTRPVKLGLRTQTQVEVLEGLQLGDRVIVSPFTLIRTLKAGDSVRVDATTPTKGGDES